ncbi:MAG: hypothetical protein ACOVQN_00655 [Exiguobacterium sp.]
MSASQSSRPSVLFRHTENIYVSLATRYSRFTITNLDKWADGTLVQLFFYYSYDKNKEHPLWIELKCAHATSKIIDGTAEFILVFGAKPLAEKRENVANLHLRRPVPGLETELQLPILSYVIKIAGKDCALGERINLLSNWNALVYAEACKFYNSCATELLKDFLPSVTVYTQLRERWNELLSIQQKTDGVRSLMFSDELFLRLIRIAHHTFDVPNYIPEFLSRALICGEQEQQLCSLMRLYHDLINLLGRFKIVRQLYKGGNFAVLASNDKLQFSLSRQPKSGYVFYFRMARSETSETSLVIEFYTVDANLKVTPIRPTPYVTLSQLDAASGNPLVAFSRIPSTHRDILAALTWNDMLYAKQIEDGVFEFKQIEEHQYEKRGCTTYIDLNWWESASILN